MQDKEERKGCDSCCCYINLGEFYVGRRIALIASLEAAGVFLEEVYPPKIGLKKKR
jgi:hypothetical protein